MGMYTVQFPLTKMISFNLMFVSGSFFTFSSFIPFDIDKVILSVSVLVKRCATWWNDGGKTFSDLQIYSSFVNKFYSFPSGFLLMQSIQNRITN